MTVDVEKPKAIFEGVSVMEKSEHTKSTTKKREGRTRRPRNHSSRRGQRTGHFTNFNRQKSLPPMPPMYPIPPCAGAPPMMPPPGHCLHERPMMCCHPHHHQIPPQMPQNQPFHPQPFVHPAITYLPSPVQQLCEAPPITPQIQMTPYGLVTATTFDGTTFYHYERPVNHDNNAHPEQVENNKNEQGTVMHPFRPAGILRTDSFSTQSPNSSVSASPNCRYSSFPSFSTSASVCSSRCSSPFLTSTDSSSVTRDSGVVSRESTDDDTASLNGETSPDAKYEMMLQMIMEQAEEIFSDEHLTKDLYLLRQIRRTARGFISVKLVASTKAIKKITRDLKSVVLALRRSGKLELNQDATKVRRNSPLPAKLPKCKDNVSVLATRLSADADLEKVAALFKSYGTIAQLRVLRPNVPLPHHLHGYATAIADLGKVTCAVVEFDDPKCAIKACKELQAKETEMQVCLLGPKVKKTLRKQTSAEKDVKIEEIAPKRALAVRHNSNDSARSDCDSGIYEVASSGLRLNSSSSVDEKESAEVKPEVDVCP
uniref:Uncharacterized protein LOC100187110 n=1 Tax=Phallusia mammillata TaxID=59560 RepID=A0A6F9DJ48_9ASCI|nr:uncharacterized protein LOC100187110 [Phallusia mammillata]